MDEFTFDWSDLAFGSKKALKGLRAVFIAAPRALSSKHFTKLAGAYLPKHNVVLGLAKESYIQGFEGQPQFRTLTLNAELESVIAKVNTSSLPHKIYLLCYFQHEAKFIFEKVDFAKVLLVNGSWRYGFHNRPEYYVLASKQTDFQFISPFANEAEAKAYDRTANAAAAALFWPNNPKGTLDATAMLALAADAAKLSFDYNFQTGAVLGKCKTEGMYTVLAHSFNKVVPYQTYAMLHGSVRETNFSPPNDLNYYDTVHAEAMLLVETQKQKIDLEGTTLFINLLPCPHCARMLSQTDIAEIVYTEDHSDGYAIHMLELSGKKVRRLVPEPKSALYYP